MNDFHVWQFLGGLFVGAILGFCYGTLSAAAKRKGEATRRQCAAMKLEMLHELHDDLEIQETDALLRGRQVCNVPARRERLERMIEEREGEGA